MKRLTISLTTALGLAVLSGPALAENICDVALAEIQRISKTGDSTAMEFLRYETPLLDPETTDRPFEGSFSGGNPPSETLDFITMGARRHEGCIEMYGRLATKRSDAASGIITRDGSYVPVSLFVFTPPNALFEANAKADGDPTGQKPQVRAGKFALNPALRAPNVVLSQHDAFKDFTIKPFVSKLESQTSVSGETVWFAYEFARGDGYQLAAAVCEGTCANFTETSDVPAPVAPVQVVKTPAVAPVKNPFAGQTLSILLHTKDGSLRQPAEIDLGEKAQGTDIAFHDSLKAALAELSNADIEARMTAITTLQSMGVIPQDVMLSGQPEPASFGYQVLLVEPEDGDAASAPVITPQPKPRQPQYLDGLVLNFDQAYASPLIDRCLPQMTISHVTNAAKPVTVDFQGSYTGNDYTRLRQMKPVTDIADMVDAGIFRSPLDQLMVKIAVPETITPIGGGNPGQRSCILSWNGIFPEKSFALSALLTDGSVPASLSQTGVVTFSDVTLESTARPVHVMVYNTTGLLDSNGEALHPDLYPTWNNGTGNDLTSALNALLRGAYDSFERTAPEIYVSEADGNKGFMNARPFTMSPETLARNLRSGDVGPESLRAAAQALSTQEAGISPRFVIIGRTGLPEKTDYCANPPKLPDGTSKGSVVIDFMPNAAVSALPSGVFRDDLSKPPYNDKTLAKAATRLAVRCPDNGSGLIHWVLTPDLSDPLFRSTNLRTLSEYIFGEQQ